MTETSCPFERAHRSTAARIRVPVCGIVAGIAIAVLSCGGPHTTGVDPAALAQESGLDWHESAEGVQAVEMPPPAPDGPLVITGQYPIESFSPSTGFPLSGGWMATSDGAFEMPLQLRGGPVRLVLRLKAIRKIGDWPSVRVLLDGKEIGRARLDGNESDVAATEQFLSPQYRMLSIPFHTEATPGPAILRVEYECTHFDPIERIGIRGIFFESLVLMERPSPGDACPGTPVTGGGKVLLIGLDGASWRVLLPMINAGRLPNLASLVREGSYGPLDSAPPTYSPSIWNSIYTGQPISVHGIEQMSIKLPSSYEGESHSSRSLKAATLWQMASVAGRSALVVGMFTTWPAQPVKGVLVTDRRIRAPIEGGVWPAEQEPAVASVLSNLESADFGIPPALPEELRGSAIGDSRTVTLARAYLTRGQPDLTTVYISMPDHAGHLLWREHAPFGLDHRYDGATPRPAGSEDPLETAYEYADRLVGSLLGSIDRENTAVVVVSDHSTDMADPMTAKRFKMGSLVEKVTGGRAYAPFDQTWIVCHIYLNLKGREPEGVVDPATYGTTGAEIREMLAALRTGSGLPVFEDVRLMPEHHDAEGEYQPADMVGIINPNLESTDSILLPDGGTMPATGLVRVMETRTGTHDRFGIVIMEGRGVRGGRLIRESTILDVAPTVMSLLGLPMAADLPGRPVAEALAQASAPCYIPSYMPIVTPAPEPGTGTGSELSSEEMEKLKALGYVQ